MSRSRAWSLVALPVGERQYGGNAGYIDDVEHTYRYDSNVPNHKQVSPGDLVFIRDAARLLGIARIEEVASEPSKKLRQRCPQCGSTGIKLRKSTPAPWRCLKGHLCETPAAEYIDVTAYEAHYGQSFLGTPEAVPVAEIKASALRPDTREKILTSIKARRGQRAFRDKLIRRYGGTCMASGCDLMDIVEAAHIDPFRGENDNHPENGLLSRTDLHTLFDLNLTGKDPEGYILQLHYRVKDASYRHLHGKSLLLGSRLVPARAALQGRWAIFLDSRT